MTLLLIVRGDAYYWNNYCFNIVCLYDDMWFCASWSLKGINPRTPVSHIYAASVYLLLFYRRWHNLEKGKVGILCVHGVNDTSMGNILLGLPHINPKTITVCVHLYNCDAILRLLFFYLCFTQHTYIEYLKEI